MPTKAKQRSQPITKSRIEKALKSSGATTMSALYRRWGAREAFPAPHPNASRNCFPTSPTGSRRTRRPKRKAAKGIKKTSPKKKTAPKTPAKKPVAKKAGGKKSYKRHAKNPFREGSGYGLVFDILAAHPKGMRRDQLVEAYAKASGKPLKTAGYDCAVVLSAKDSVTGPRHRSCRNGFFCIKENLFCRLMLS